ncbi:glycoside hydrolase [Crassaminicella thermophila]|uniref:Glycoside hydrolase n=1 Tax=Crassaminicella thermophila TaxID=2599308 RepID=A0A5C0SE26_CRATE|nr:glycosyl hydrolase family 8 [Crassaminicella thermophila]QEK12845.1 glycoside hydrolase [Crassaminicella thermophila]
MKRIFIIFMIIILFGRFIMLRQPEFYLERNIGYGHEYLEEEKSCLEFIKTKMSSNKGGIYTNYLDTDEIGELAKGYQILSESEGLIMQYYVEKGDKKGFDQHLDLVKNKMMGDEGLIRWRIREENNQISNSSASLDDLRIVRSLIYAYDLWKEEKYYKILKRISKGLLKYSTNKGYLTSYYEFGSKYRAKKIDLCYIDLYTMNLLRNVHRKWEVPYKNGLKIIQGGYISNKLPLYKKSFNIDSKRYSTNENINSIEALLVVLHLSEMNLVKQETIKWIRKQVFGKGIFLEYNIKTGYPICEDESTAVYAITARIAKNIRDEALYKQAMKRMLRLQILDKTSPLYGAFGNIDTYEVFSFDNLQALLAF